VPHTAPSVEARCFRPLAVNMRNSSPLASRCGDGTMHYSLRSNHVKTHHRFVMICLLRCRSGPEIILATCLRKPLTGLWLFQAFHARAMGADGGQEAGDRNSLSSVFSSPGYHNINSNCQLTQFNMPYSASHSLSFRISVRNSSKLTVIYPSRSSS
jgi:hypothetical protein